MKERMTALLLALVMVLALTACGGGAAPANDEAAEAPAEEAQPTEEAEPTAEPTPTPVPTPEPTPEPEYRLTKVVDGGAEYTFAYGQGGYRPTEILRNGESVATASYDEAGHITAYEEAQVFSESYTYDERGEILENTWTNVYGDIGSDIYTYDEAGNCIRNELTIDHADGTVETLVYEYTYDEAGNRIRSESTDNYTDGTVETSVYEYTYDEVGNLTQEEGTTTDADGAVTTSAYKYTYDEAGNRARSERTYTARDGTVTTSVTEYTYDEEGRMLSYVRTDADGAVYTTTYSYSEDGHATKQIDSDGTTQINYKMPMMEMSWNSTGHSVMWKPSFLGNHYFFNISTESEPKTTYDENGYLVKVEGTGGTMELTYEPIA